MPNAENAEERSLAFAEGLGWAGREDLERATSDDYFKFST